MVDLLRRKALMKLFLVNCRFVTMQVASKSESMKI